MTLQLDSTHNGAMAEGVQSDTFHLISLFESLSEILSLSVLLLGVCVIVGWMFDIAFLKSVFPGWPAMKVNLAAGFMLLSASLWMLQTTRAHSPFRLTAHLCSSAVVLIGALTLLEYIAGWDIGIDQLLYKESPGALFTAHLGRPSPLAALNLVLAGLAIMNIDARDWRGIQPGHVALSVVGITSLLTFLGHLNGVPHFLHFLPGSSAIAFNATLGFLLLTVAILFARPTHGVTAILISDTAGGVLARRMFFPSVAFMLVIDSVINVGQKAGFYDDPSGTALHTTFLLVFFTGIIVTTSTLLEKTDIHRKQADAALTEAFFNMHELRNIVESNTDIFYVHNPEGKLIKWNRALEKLTGLSRQGLMLKPALEFVCEEDRPLVMQKMREVFEKGFCDVEARFISGDGTLVPHLCNGYLIKDTNGNVTGFAGTGNDISERKRMEETLRQSEARYRELFENASDYVYTTDMGGIFTSVNRALCERSGYRAEELVGAPIGKLVSPASLEKARKMTEAKMEACSHTQYEIEIIAKNGDVILIEVSSRLIIENGKLAGVQGIGRDIGERKRAETKLQMAKEAAEAATHLKDKFVSLVAHDLSSPLASVIMMQKLALSSLADSKFDECKTALGNSVGLCERMTGMTGELLESARLQGGAIRLNRKICNIKDICDTVIDDLNHLAAKKEVVLKNEVPHGTKLYVDRVLFQRVIHNLVMNAIKFSNKGGMVTTSISGGQNILMVKDTGIGINEELLPDLFKHEIQTTATGTSGERGTGFGLPMSLDIVKAHGGKIWTSSPKGEGAVFFDSSCNSL